MASSWSRLAEGEAAGRDHAHRGKNMAVTEHLPECWIVSHANPLNGCICTELRACEQRVAAMRKDSGELWLDGYGTGFQDGYSFCLDAAREAVAAVPHGISWGKGLHIHRDGVLAAIDALREKP